MSDRYLPASSLTSSYLDANTPPGLFQTYHGGKPSSLFLVIADDDGTRHAVFLDETGPNHFRAWKAAPEAKSWNGVSLGAVVLEVDTSSAISHHSGEAGSGDVTVLPNGYWLTCRLDGLYESTGVRVGDTTGGTPDSPGHVFRRWRLIKRDERGGVNVLFAHNSNTESVE